MFRITMSKGFQMTFANGVTVSVQFGPGNYCDNRDMDFDKPAKSHELLSETAEFAAWHKDGTWCTKEVFKRMRGEELGDDVAGWLTAGEVFQAIQAATELPRSLN